MIERFKRRMHLSISAFRGDLSKPVFTYAELHRHLEAQVIAIRIIDAKLFHSTISNGRLFDHKTFRP
jgi:hypothetical protein